MKVKVKDYEREVHRLKTALNMSGLNIDYQTADLLHTILKKIDGVGDQFSLMDGAKIEVSHEEKWNNYFKKLLKKTEEDEV